MNATGIPAWPEPYLDVDIANLTARLLRQPLRAEIPVICDERLVVEFYSR
jgi:small subunit ribosomal protein S4